MKKIIFAVILGVLGLSMLMYKPFAQAASSEVKLYLSPASASGNTNDTLTLNLREDSGNEPVNVVTTNITFSPSKLQFLNITPSEQFSLSSYDYGEGVININYQAAILPQTNDQPVATIMFKILANSGSFNVTLDPIIGSGHSALVSSQSHSNILEAVYSGSYNVAPTTTPPSPPTTNSPPSGSTTPPGNQNISDSAAIALPAEAQGLLNARHGSTTTTDTSQNSLIPDKVVLLAAGPAIILAAIASRYLNRKYGFLSRSRFRYRYAKESIADVARRVNRPRADTKRETVAELAARMNRLLNKKTGVYLIRLSRK